MGESIMSITTIKFIAQLLPFLLVASSIAAATSTAKNAMTKCFHHRGTLSDKVVCYFSEDPICTHHPRLSDKQEAQEKLVRFFLPMTQFATSDVKQLAQQVSDRTEKGYTMQFKQVEVPMHGIQLEIAYDPTKIDFSYARFDAISAHKGLVFNFSHKAVMNEIQRKSEGISKLASHKAKQPSIVIDCGHGGSDVGKIGLYNICEKDVNLSVGFQVADALKKRAIGSFVRAHLIRL